MILLRLLADFLLLFYVGILVIIQINMNFIKIDIIDIKEDIYESEYKGSGMAAFAVSYR